jgi:choline dehydrogenase-like flavoprotein
MLIQSDTLEPNALLRAQCCVIGSGMGGSAVATRLSRAGKDVLLVEAGRTDSAPDDRSPIKDEHTGRPFGIPLTRCIELGGTSNAWHGICTPLEEIDFAPRPWLDQPGWPIRRSDLDPFYDDAAEMLGHARCSGLDPNALPPGTERELGVIPFDRSVLAVKHLEWRKPPHRWKQTLMGLAQTDKLRCLLDTTALELVPTEDGSRIAHLKAAAPGRAIRIEAEEFIVCAGALETPRLLLNSRSRCADGIGNDHGMVGRFLMDHPTGPFSMLRFRSTRRARAYSGLPLPDGSTHFMAALALDPQIQKSAAVPNHYFIIRPCIAGKHVRPDLRLSFAATRSLRDLTANQAMGILCSPNLLYRILIMRCELPAYYRYGEVFFFTEQLPNPKSRVGLSHSSRDAFDYPIASIHWQPDANDFSGFLNFARTALDKGLQSSRYRTILEGSLADWIEKLTSAAHHLGTARMADRPDRGVVNAHLQVFGVDNLYVCDGSVFATAGSANPSLTITALGARLADHLLRKSDTLPRETRVASDVLSAVPSPG